MKTADYCRTICNLTSDCTNFTWQEGEYCYLVNTPYWLHYDSDKISGDRECNEEPEEWFTLEVDPNDNYKYNDYY